MPPRFQKRIFFPELWSEKEKEEWGKGWVVKEVFEKNRMKTVLSIIFFIIPTLLFAQSKEVKVFYDDERNHLKERYFVKDLDPSVLYGTYESYYISGELKSKGQYIDDETYGQWKYYYESGILKMQGQLKDNSNHGLWSYYFENGELRMEGKIYNGLRQGNWKYFYETGVLKAKENILMI